VSDVPLVLLLEGFVLAIYFNYLFLQLLDFVILPMKCDPQQDIGIGISEPGLRMVHLVSDVSFLHFFEEEPL